jgi:predicted amidophosphoribosyltransferase
MLQIKGASQMQELLCSLANSHHRPSAAMCAAVVARLQMAELSKLRPDGAMKLLWALAQLNMATPPLLAALHAWKPSKKKFTSEQLATILWCAIRELTLARSATTLYQGFIKLPTAVANYQPES